VDLAPQLEALGWESAQPDKRAENRSRVSWAEREPVGRESWAEIVPNHVRAEKAPPPNDRVGCNIALPADWAETQPQLHAKKPFTKGPEMWWAGVVPKAPCVQHTL
jgi:hypothetical protein